MHTSLTSLTAASIAPSAMALLGATAVKATLILIIASALALVARRKRPVDHERERRFALAKRGAIIRIERRPLVEPLFAHLFEAATARFFEAIAARLGEAIIAIIARFVEAVAVRLVEELLPLQRPSEDVVLRWRRLRLRSRGGWRFADRHHGEIVGHHQQLDHRIGPVGIGDRQARGSLEGGRELYRFTGHQASVTAVAVTPDGSRILSISPIGARRQRLVQWYAKLERLAASLAVIAVSGSAVLSGLALAGVNPDVQIQLVVPWLDVGGRRLTLALWLDPLAAVLATVVCVVGLVVLAVVGGMAPGAMAALMCGKLLDTVGRAIVFAACGVSAFFAPLVFLGGMRLELIGMILWGMGMGAQDSCLKALLAAVTPSQKRSTAFGVFDTGFGIAWFAGSAIMGLLYDKSILGLIVFSVVLQLAALPVLALADKGGNLEKGV